MELEDGALVLPSTLTPSPMNTPPVVIVSPLQFPRRQPASLSWAPERSSGSMPISMDALDGVRQTLDFPDEIIVISDDDDKPEQQQQQQETREKEQDKPAGELRDFRGYQIKLADAIPAGLVIVMCLAIRRFFLEKVSNNCNGCIHDRPSQKHHYECLILTWEERVEKYFREACRSLREVEVQTWPCRKPLGAQKIHPVTIYMYLTTPHKSNVGLTLQMCGCFLKIWAQWLWIDYEMIN